MEFDKDLTTDQIIRLMYTSVKKIETAMTVQEAKVVKLEADVDILNHQVYELQNTVNHREQELRGLSIRITGFSYTDDEKATTDAKFLPKKLFERLISPLLVQAKTNGIIDKVPTLVNTIQSCYRLGGRAALTGTGRPPPILLKFCNETVRLAVLKVKRTSTPAPSAAEQALGIKHFIISEDLTPATYKKMKDLKADERVEKVWTVGGRIQFVLDGSKTVHRAKSVFDSVDKIISLACR